MTARQLKSVGDDPRMTRAAFMEFVERVGDISTARFIVLELLSEERDNTGRAPAVVTPCENGTIPVDDQVRKEKNPCKRSLLEALHECSGRSSSTKSAEYRTNGDSVRLK